MNATKLVDALLETEHDEHVKAYERIKKWDTASSDFERLFGLKKKSLDTMRELGASIAYERALARVGLTREEVDHHIYGGHISATHNYKGKELLKKCADKECNPLGRFNLQPFVPGEERLCPQCQKPMVEEMAPISPQRLKTKYERYIVGVVTNDGRTVWFTDPVPPKSAFV